MSPACPLDNVVADSLFGGNAGGKEMTLEAAKYIQENGGVTCPGVCYMRTICLWLFHNKTAVIPLFNNHFLETKGAGGILPDIQIIFHTFRAFFSENKCRYSPLSESQLVSSPYPPLITIL